MTTNQRPFNQTMGGPFRLRNEIEITDRMVATKVNVGTDALKTLTWKSTVTISVSFPASRDPSSYNPTSVIIFQKIKCQEDFLQRDPDLPCWTLKCNCFSTRILGVDWNRADRFCRAENLTLLSIEAQEEDRLIHHHLASELPVYGSTYWTSRKYYIPQWEWAST